MKDRALMKIAVPQPFHMGLTVMSHGFVDLLPFQWEREARCLHGVIRTRGSKAFALKIFSEKDNQPGQKLKVLKAAGPRASKDDLVLLEERIRWCLRLDEDLSPFQNRCGRTQGLGWVKKYGLGRFLRNSDPFEEFTKVLITTNINWSGTKVINQNLLDHMGDPVGASKTRPAGAVKGGPVGAAKKRGGSYRAFPTAQRVAEQSEQFLRDKIRLGYRAPYLLELAAAFAEGRIDEALFADPAQPVQALTRALAALKGFGPYAVNSLLMSFSRYENLILDSWIRRVASNRHFKGKRATDSAIRKVYAPWGKWAALACWCECIYDSWIKDELRGRSRGIVVDS